MADRLTINEYAKKENISRQAVYKRAKSGKIKLIREEENEQIRVYVIEALQPDQAEQESAEKETTPQNSINDILSRQIDILSHQLEEKDRQIEKLNSNIAELTELLRGAQQLQAHTQLLLEGHKEQESAEAVNDIQPENVSGMDTGTEDKPKKKSIFSWLFD